MVNRTRGVELADRARIADTRWTRLRGLLGRPRLQAGQGLVISPSRGVHTWGMDHPIDVALLGEDGRVADIYPGLAPWSHTGMHGDVELAVELPEGTIAATGTQVGDRIDIHAAASGAEITDGAARARDGRADDGHGIGGRQRSRGRGTG